MNAQWALTMIGTAWIPQDLPQLPDNFHCCLSNSAFKVHSCNKKEHIDRSPPCNIGILCTSGDPIEKGSTWWGILYLGDLLKIELSNRLDILRLVDEAMNSTG